jgi:multicomponent Na+:H+ antiporter subunit G
METLLSIIIVLGAFFTLVAAIGLVRFPDFYTRMHAVTKAGAFGGTIILIGAALCFGSLKITVLVGINIIFFYFTAPIAAHMIARSAYINRIKPWHKTELDELKGKIELKDPE